MTDQLEHRRKLDQVLDEGFASDVTALDVEVLRERRTIAGDVENELSYYRRLLHGRMDLLDFEVRRRAGTETRSLIEALPDILGAGETAGGDSAGRLHEVYAPDWSGEGKRHIDHVLNDDFLSRLPDMEDSELAEVQGSLAEAEEEVSGYRKVAQRTYDDLHAEILRRYKEGLASTEGLLSS